MKRLLSTVFILFLNLVMFGNVNGNENIKSKNILTKQLIMSKLTLNKNIELQPYIAKIDYLVDNLSEWQLDKLLNRINSLPNGSNGYLKYKYFFMYLEAKISLKLLEINKNIDVNTAIWESDYFIDNYNLYKIISHKWSEFIIEYLGDDEYILKSKEGYYFFNWMISWESVSISEQWDLYILLQSKSGAINLLINWIEKAEFKTEKELINVFQIEGNNFSYIDGKDIIPLEFIDLKLRHEVVENQDYFENGEFYVNSRIKSKEFRHFLQRMWDNIRKEYINKNKNIWNIYQINHLNNTNTKVKFTTYWDYIHYFIDVEGYRYEVKWRLSEYGGDILILENKKIGIVIKEDNKNILYINWESKWIFNKDKMIVMKQWKYFINIDDQEILVEDFSLGDNLENKNFKLFTAQKLKNDEYREYIFNQ